jgi:gliding motility-associated protein GldM
MSIPKEPRQLMINIMYLVLTALLALNVSAEIFNAFEMVDKGLISANNSLDEKNAELPALIKERAEKRDAYKVYSDRVDDARQISSDANESIDEVIAFLIDQSGDKDGVVGDGDYRDDFGKIVPKGKRNHDITTRYLVDEGKGEELKDKLLAIKQQFLQLIDEEERVNYASKIPIEIDDETWKVSKNPKRKSWADHTFNHMPLGATLPIFSKFKNDIKSSEAAVLNYLLGKVGGEDVVLDKFKVVSAPKRTYVIKGETFETDVFLSASASADVNTGISIAVNGKRLRTDADGVAKYTASTSSTGKKSYNATISVENPVTQEINTYKSSFEYEVGERSVTVSPSKMNVFYIGVDNPVEISAAGVNSTKVNVSMAGSGGGSINRNSDGTYNVTVKTPTKKGEFAKVNVSAEGLNVSKDFRVKRIPDPVPKLGNKRGGSMGNGEFKAYGSVRAALDNFDFDARCDIVGYRLVRVAKRQDPEFSINKGGKYTGDSQRLVNKAAPSDRYFYENIKCRCPGDPAPRDIGQLVISIN